MTEPLLPEFSGTTNSSGCQNPDCNANGRYLRVVSREEMERIFPALSEMSFAPLPPQATHVCDRCGYVYSGMNGKRLETKSIDPGENRPTVDIDEYDWDPSEAFEKTVLDAAVSLVAGAPQDAEWEEVAEAIEQYIPGLSRDDMSDVVEHTEREFDAPAIDPTEFM